MKRWEFPGIRPHPLLGIWWSTLGLLWQLWVFYLACWCVTVSVYWGSRSSWNWLVCHLVQLLNHVWIFGTQWTAAQWDTLSFTISWSLLKFMCIELVMLSNHLILCRPFFFCPQSFPALGSFPMNELFA